MRHRITVRNRTPIIEEGQRYSIVSYSHQPKVGEYHIEIEADPSTSGVTLHEGATPAQDQITIHDLNSVTVLGAYQVAF